MTKVSKQKEIALSSCCKNCNVLAGVNDDGICRNCTDNRYGEQFANRKLINIQTL